jgi:hypothetical protein
VSDNHSTFNYNVIAGDSGKNFLVTGEWVLNGSELDSSNTVV